MFYIINQDNSDFTVTTNREQYEKDLRRRQQEHLDSIKRQNDMNWTPCAHDQCSSCHGTGVRHDGSSCVHAISCPCPKCSPYCLAV